MTSNEAVLVNALKIINTLSLERYNPTEKHRYENTAKTIHNVAKVTLDSIEEGRP